MAIAILIYLEEGFFVIDAQSDSLAKIAVITLAREHNFNISGGALLPELILMTLAFKKIQPLPTLFAGAALGACLPYLCSGKAFSPRLTMQTSVMLFRPLLLK